MRHHGRITNWKDDQGFGFIAPRDGGDPVFVHVKAFANRKRRPVANEEVTYVLAADAKGRARAEAVAFAGDRWSAAAPRGRGWGALVIAVLFLASVCAAAKAGRLPVFVAGLYLGASLVAFAAYALDKAAAKKERRRTPESTLHLFGLIGGWPGALVAQRLLRHKSRKLSFQVVFWITVMLNCGALLWLGTQQMSGTLRSLARAFT